MKVFRTAVISSVFLVASAQLLPSPNLRAQSIMSDGQVALSDVMGLDRSINVFAGFTRDISAVSDRLDSSLQNTTVLAPLNSAITSLPRKPWEDPAEYKALGSNAYHGEDGQDRASRNLERFVQAHIVPESPWKEGHKIKTLEGNTVWWEQKGGKKLIQPGDVEVSSIPNKVANGEVWILSGALNYA